jgi:hypothetical protein
MTLEELEDVYMNGFADEVTGATEHGPVNHIYRVGNQLVETTSTGAQYVVEYETEADAVREFGLLEELYNRWEGGEGHE